MLDTEVHRIFSELEWSRVLAARREGDRRVFFLDGRAPWAAELKALLDAMVRLRPECRRSAEMMDRRDRRLGLGPHTKFALERRRIEAAKEARRVAKNAPGGARNCPPPELVLDRRSGPWLESDMKIIVPGRR